MEAVFWLPLCSVEVVRGWYVVCHLRCVILVVGGVFSLVTPVGFSWDS